MSYALLWIEALTSALLWMALLAACFSRIKRRWAQAILMSLASALPLLLFAFFVFVAIMFRFLDKMEDNWLVYAATLFIGAFIGLAGILIWVRRREAGMESRALTWRRGPLAAAWLVSVSLAWMTLWNMDSAIRARANVLAIEADALCLATNPPIPPDAENAATLYEKAFARLRDDPPRDVDNPPVGNSLTFDPKEPAMLAFLGRQAPTLALLRQAAAMPACRFDEELTAPRIEELISSGNEELRVARYLDLDARHEIAEGHVSNAIADIDAIFKMSRQFGQQPVSISGLVAIGIDAIAVSRMQEVLPAVKHPEEIAGLNLQSLSPIRRILWRSLQEEERFGLDRFSGVGYEDLSLAGAANGPTSDFEPMIGNPLFRVLILPDELDAYLQIMGAFKQAARQPYFKTKEQLAGMEDSYSPNRLHKGFLSSVMAPSMMRSCQTAAKAEAGDACAEVAVAMTRYRLDHGSLPDHLGDLVPAYLDSIPLDPFDGQPLRMIVKDNQWILYSTGTGTDEWSHAMPDQKKGNVVFVLKAGMPATRP